MFPFSPRAFMSQIRLPGWKLIRHFFNPSFSRSPIPPIPPFSFPLIVLFLFSLSRSGDWCGF